MLDEKTLEAFGRDLVKNASQTNVDYARQKATTRPPLGHEPVSTWTGPSVRSKHDG